LNDLPRCELEPRSSHHKGIFFEVPYCFSFFGGTSWWFIDKLDDTTNDVVWSFPAPSPISVGSLDDEADLATYYD
jgi:hypothetical protein